MRDCPKGDRDADERKDRHCPHQHRRLTQLRGTLAVDLVESGAVGGDTGLHLGADRPLFVVAETVAHGLGSSSMRSDTVKPAAFL